MGKRKKAKEAKQVADHMEVVHVHVEVLYVQRDVGQHALRRKSETRRFSSQSIYLRH